MRSQHTALRPARLAGLLITPLLLMAGLAGCPPSWPFPLHPEDVYGYNEFVFRNEGDRPVSALYLIRSGDPTRGKDFIAFEEGLAPNRATVVDKVRNGTYTVEVEYTLTAEEAGGAAPVVATQRVQNLRLYWGESYTWYWYGPGDDVDLGPIVDPPDDGGDGGDDETGDDETATAA